MWARKRIDIGFLDLMLALWRCLNPLSNETAVSLPAPPPVPQQCLIALSVRSGFDLLLSEQDWPVNSEIIFTGLTIPDMPRIAREHGYHPIGVDLDISNLEPAIDEIQRLVTPRTKAIVVAHLLGGRLPTNEISVIAKKHDLLVIEDFAQSYQGQIFLSGDVAMFSFGTIKTNTALGGAIMVIADSKLLERMVSRQKSWPRQSRLQYARRVLKYSLVKFISTRPVARAIRRACRFFPGQHDSLAAGMAKSFSGGDFLKKIRHRPSIPLSHTLAHKILNFQDHCINNRIRRGKLLTDTIRKRNPKIKILGDEIEQASYWIFGILVQNPGNLIELLWKHGFDATTQSSLQAISPSDNQEPLLTKTQLTETQPAYVISLKLAREKQEKLANVNFILSQLVFLPVDLPMPESELIRMGELVARHAIPTTLAMSNEPGPKAKNSIPR